MRNLLMIYLGAATLAACRPGEGQDAAPPPAPAPVAASPGSPSPRGRWVEARQKTLPRYASAVGSFRSRQTTRVGSQVSGRVKEVLVDVGDAVRKDQVLVRLDPVLFELERAMRQADLQAARVALAEAELNHGRMKTLWEKPSGETPSIPRKLYDDACTRRDSAAARVQQAEAALRHAEERLRETEIRAPYDGVVSRRFVDAGEPVTSMPITPLVEVQETGVLELEFALPQHLLASVRTGTPVEFSVEGLAGSRGTGRVDVLHPAVDESTRSFRCRCRVDNAEGRYRPGLLAEVRVREGEIPDAVVVPRGALAAVGGEWEIRVRGEGGEVRRRVRVGASSDGEVQILEGVQAGESVFLPEE